MFLLHHGLHVESSQQCCAFLSPLDLGLNLFLKCGSPCLVDNRPLLIFSLLQEQCKALLPQQLLLGRTGKEAPMAA